jgi:hypothetical protein
MSVRAAKACHKSGPRKNVAMLPNEAEHLAAEVLKLREALKMLYDLLEEYAPLWYTEELRAKAQAALRSWKGT